jgi:NitT/TauT family transport system permease protein
MLEHKTVRYVVFTIIVIAIWQLVYFFINDSLIFPSLFETLEYLIKNLQDPNQLLLNSIKGSVGVLIECMGLAILTVFLILILTTTFKIIKEFFIYLCAIINPVPTFAWFPIFLIMLGYDRTTLYSLTVFCVSGFALIQLIGQIEAARNIWEEQVENLKFNILQSLVYVYLPALLPAVLSTVKNMFNQMFRILFAVETFFGLLGGGYSIGGLMTEYKGAFETTELFSVLLFVMIFGLFVNVILEYAYQISKRKIKNVTAS